MNDSPGPKCRVGVLLWKGGKCCCLRGMELLGCSPLCSQLCSSRCPRRRDVEALLAQHPAALASGTAGAAAVFPGMNLGQGEVACLPHSRHCMGILDASEFVNQPRVQREGVGTGELPHLCLSLQVCEFTFLECTLIGKMRHINIHMVVDELGGWRRCFKQLLALVHFFCKVYSLLVICGFCSFLSF